MASVCSCNEKLVKEIKSFLENVRDVKEESITDYLVWKWAEMDKRFRVHTYSRIEEHKISGADFDLELWIVGRSKILSLAVQAKKFRKPYDAYATKIKYPKCSSQQID